MGIAFAFGTVATDAWTLGMGCVLGSGVQFGGRTYVGFRSQCFGLRVLAFGLGLRGVHKVWGLGLLCQCFFRSLCQRLLAWQNLS